jgi:uncharacterized iron-regulated protein
MNARALSVALPLALAACAPRFDPKLVDSPIAGRTWVATEHRDHPLVGRIWDVRAASFVDEGALSAAVAAADFVALGEVHDNPDHHLLQARLVRAATSAGRRPALAFEMLAADQQEAVDAAVARAPKDPDALAEAVQWKTSRWPEWKLYRPIFAAGLEAGLPIVAANLTRDQVKQLVMKGREALDEGLRVRLAREEPIPEAVLAELREEMKESHCGEMPEAMLEPLVLAQRARDARMAERSVNAGGERGAILVTGKGHARTDRGVPALVAKDLPGRKVLGVGFFEVDPAATTPDGYVERWGKGPLPFDLVVFTPGVKREDPCVALKERMERKRAREKAAAQESAAAPGTDAAPGAAGAAPEAAKPPSN